jgi:alkanesulfonate monooxygenase SsuD/methylene tetrahydromethanopterin reductase-like flavin-dependent oxidoreductase (luciferase family)
MVKVGVCLPSRLGPGALTQRQLLGAAVAIDRHPGWDHLWVPDSVISLPFYDSVVSLAAIAAVTDRVRLGVACFASLGLRHPLIVAQQWANLDCLSEGRMTMVACPGEATGPSRQRELAEFGLSHQQKALRMEEAVLYLRRLSAGPGLLGAGPDLPPLVPSFRQHPLPIWMTANPRPSATPGTLDRVLGRVARLGDGWLTFAVTPKVLRHRLERLGELAVSEGRPLGPGFPVCVYLNVNVGPDPKAAMTDAVETWQSESSRPVSPTEVAELAAVGTPEQCAGVVAELVAAGANKIAFGLLSHDPLAQLDRLGEHVLPLLLSL